MFVAVVVVVVVVVFRICSGMVRNGLGRPGGYYLGVWGEKKLKRYQAAAQHLAGEKMDWVCGRESQQPWNALDEAQGLADSTGCFLGGGKRL